MPQWELLVTDGHVRAARWRVASKFVGTTAIVLIILGLAGLWALPPRKSASNILDAKQRLLETRRQSLSRFMSSKGEAPTTLPENADKAFAPSQASNLIDRITDELNKTDTLPQDVTTLTAKEFWDGNWSPGTAAAVNSKRTILIGFYMNEAAAYPRFQGSEPQIALVRIFGLFRKAGKPNTKWAFYCLNVPGAPPCGRSQSLSPETIPDTLYDLTPGEARP